MISWKTKRSLYNENKEAIENYEQLSKEFKSIDKKITLKNEEHECCKKETLEFYKTNGSLEQKLAQIKAEEQEKEQMQKTVFCLSLANDLHAFQWDLL